MNKIITTGDAHLGDTGIDFNDFAKWLQLHTHGSWPLWWLTHLEQKRPSLFDGVLGGSGYLGYVDSNQGYNPYKWVICTQILGL